MEGKLRLMSAICTWDLSHNSLVLILGLHSAWTWVKDHKSTQSDVCHILPNRIEEVKESDPRSNVHYLSRSENKTWKKIQACTGFEPMTSAIPVQHSTNWANKLKAVHVFSMKHQNMLGTRKSGSMLLSEQLCTYPSLGSTTDIW